MGNFQSKTIKILKDHNSSNQQNSEMGKIPQEDLKSLLVKMIDDMKEDTKKWNSTKNWEES